MVEWGMSLESRHTEPQAIGAFAGCLGIGHQPGVFAMFFACLGIVQGGPRIQFSMGWKSPISMFFFTPGKRIYSRPFIVYRGPISLHF